MRIKIQCPHSKKQYMGKFVTVQRALEYLIITFCYEPHPYHIQNPMHLNVSLLPLSLSWLSNSHSGDVLPRERVVDVGNHHTRLAHRPIPDGHALDVL